MVPITRSDSIDKLVFYDKSWFFKIFNYIFRIDLTLSLIPTYSIQMIFCDLEHNIGICSWKWHQFHVQGPLKIVTINGFIRNFEFWK